MSIKVCIGRRLKEERKRLRLSQTDFAALVGITRRTQCAYERGESAPDGVYLAMIAKLGMDVLYILTRQKQ